MTHIYFDNNATTLMPKEIQDAMIKWTNRGNPSSGYAVAQHTKTMINNFREYIARICGFELATGDIDHSLDANKISANKYRVIFTSCASESNSTIIRSTIDAYTEHVGVRPHIVCSAIEHKGIISQIDSLAERGLLECTYVMPEETGHVTPGKIQSSIRTNTCLVICMHANNETGAINNIKEIGRIAHVANVPFHCDIVQTFGKHAINPIANNIDSCAVSFHKLLGPPGIGMLIIKEQFLCGHRLAPMVFGTQNDGFRGGTENVPGIGASAAALKLTMENRPRKNVALREMKQYIMSEIRARMPTCTYSEYVRNISSKGKKHDMEIVFISQLDDTYLINTILLSVIKRSEPRLCNVKLKSELEKQNILVSIGSACNTSSSKASHVLYAIGADEHIRAGALRISLGDYNKLLGLAEVIIVA